jgi:hypothetical protein
MIQRRMPTPNEPVLLGQPRVPEEIQLVAAFYQNRKLLKGEIEVLEEGLTCCSQEEKPALEEALAWLRSKLVETGPAFARAISRAAPMIREGFQTTFENLTRATE